MKIAICDDDEKYCSHIYKLINQYAELHDLGFDVNIFTSVEVLESAMQIVGYDLLFLDIEMPDISGIAFKNKLLLQHNRTWIVFVTHHEELMHEAFGVNVLGFAKKEHLDEQILWHLDLMLKLWIRDYHIEGKFHSRDIVHIHSEKEYSILECYNNKREYIRSSLRSLEKSLEEVDFVRASRSSLVNLKYIEEIKDNVCYTEFGTEIHVSRRCMKKLQEKFLEYSERNARYY